MAKKHSGPPRPDTRTERTLWECKRKLSNITPIYLELSERHPTDSNLRTGLTAANNAHEIVHETIISFEQVTSDRAHQMSKKNAMDLRTPLREAILHVRSMRKGLLSAMEEGVISADSTAGSKTVKFTVDRIQEVADDLNNLDRLLTVYIGTGGKPGEITR
ncbi:MAG: hypothetical protein AB7L92_03105 [Alphaproteobacteria bacterium]